MATSANSDRFPSGPGSNGPRRIAWLQALLQRWGEDASIETSALGWSEASDPSVLRGGDQDAPQPDNSWWNTSAADAAAPLASDGSWQGDTTPIDGEARLTPFDGITSWREGRLRQEQQARTLIPLLFGLLQSNLARTAPVADEENGSADQRSDGSTRSQQRPDQQPPRDDSRHFEWLAEPIVRAEDDDPVEPAFAGSGFTGEPVRADQSSTVQGFAYDTILTDSDQAVDALVAGVRWGTGGPSTALTYSFPTEAANYEAGYYDSTAIASVSELNASQKQAARKVFQSYTSISGLVFTELSTTAGSVSNADLRLARSTAPKTAYCYYPNADPVGGDSFFGSSTTTYDNPTVGNYSYHTFLHEEGHALGLKHGQETNGPGAIPYELDSMEYSVMTYRAYVGASTTIGYTNETWGYAQSLMMLDIAAIQRLYGANYTINSGNTTYSFDPTNGAFLIDGNTVETPGANRIFRTIWDGAGIDTYDFSNYITRLNIDLTPGSFCDLDAGGNAQRAVLQRYATGSYTLSNGSSVYLTYTTARGHVFNALLNEGNTGSLIENANGGEGNDTLRGNQANNVLRGNGGNDVFLDSSGSDTCYGGAGSDAAYFNNAINQYSFSYNPTTSFLSIALNGSTDLDRIYNDVEWLYFQNNPYAFSLFNDLIAPTLISSNPADDATAVATADALVLTFSETVLAGSGQIVLSTAGDTRAIEINDASQVSLAGSSLTLKPLQPLKAQSSYTLEIGAGVILDSAGNAFAGLVGAGALNFTTAAPPVLAITPSGAVQAEGNSGTTTYSFSVSRSGDLSRSSSATWSVSGNGGAPADADDFGGSLPSGRVEFAPNVSEQTITVLVSGDVSIEADESFLVSLTAPDNASLGNATAEATISDDDAPPPVLAISVSGAVQSEGNTGTTTYSFSVSRSGDLSKRSSATWTVSGNGGAPADADDFSGSLPSGRVEFAPNVSEQTITVLVSGDVSFEADEGFLVSLTAPDNASLANATAAATISNDDAPPPVLVISAGSAVQPEGNTGTTAYSFIVSRSGDLSRSSSATWSVSGSGSAPADADDFGGSLPSGSVEFAPDVDEQTITVLVAGDVSVETNEGFLVQLSAPNNASLGTATVEATISNDDVTPAVITGVSTSASDGSLAVGEAISFVVSFSQKVFVSGNPLLKLSNGGIATYQSGSGTSKLSFTYLVAPTDASTADLATAPANAVDLAAGAIVNLIGLAANLSGADALNPDGVTSVDPTAPLLKSMTVDGNNVILSFDEAVYADGLVAAAFKRQIGTATAVAASTITVDTQMNRLILSFSGTAPGSSSAVKLSYSVPSGSSRVRDAAGNGLGVFQDRVVDTYQSATTVTTLGDGGSTLPASSYVNLTLTGTSIINGNGNNLANVILGNTANNILDGKAGIDRLDGREGSDIYLIASAGDHSAAEIQDSGSSGRDELRFTSGLSGQTLMLYAGDTGLEAAVIGTGTSSSATTSGTTSLNINAAAVLNGLSLTGNAGANSISGTNFNDSLIGNAGVDTLTGLAGADTITGGAGLDVLSGGTDADSFVYTNLTDALPGGTSSARSFERITDFQPDLDRIDAPGSTTRSIKALGSVTALTDTAIGTLLNASSGGTVNFAANGAASFSFGTRTFLALNNGTTGYSASTDAIIEITNSSSGLAAANLSGFIVI